MFGFLTWELPGEGAGVKTGSGSRFGKAGAVSLRARGFARSRISARTPRKLLLSAPGQNSCLVSHEAIRGGWRKDH